jgi:4-hydroxybenzoate polyprenyltransferase
LQVARAAHSLFYPHGVQTPFKFRDWASMARLPNVPTVWSNVFTGWILGLGGFSSDADWANFVWVLLIATLFYVGGTVLNDCHDADYDCQNRPERPIASGRVPRLLACMVGAVLLGLGSCLSLWPDHSFFYENSLFWLLPLILFYTFTHKRFPLIGGVLMGLCRMVLGLGVYYYRDSLGAGIGIHELIRLPWTSTLFAYVCFLSWIAMGEKLEWRRKTVVCMLTALPLLDAAFLIIAGEVRMILVPLGCAGLAWYLRRYASPT